MKSTGALIGVMTRCLWRGLSHDVGQCPGGLVGGAHDAAGADSPGAPGVGADLPGLGSGGPVELGLGRFILDRAPI